MFGEQTTIISSPDNSGSRETGGTSEEPKSKIKRRLLIGGLVFILLLIVAGGFWYLKKLNSAPPLATAPTATSTATSTGSLPNLTSPDDLMGDNASSTFANIAIEYLSFADFYRAPNNDLEIKFSDYELPLNVKIDVLNYYDLSRKLNLDPALSSLNLNGFALIDNPWSKEAPDFYSVYTNLEQKQIPFLITSDFIVYYYQTILKKAYKDIEENIFYDNLWSIVKDLYNSAKNRYESRLAAIGNINDPVLEGERLEVSFFAVALELLKPSAEQISPQGTLDDSQKFISSDRERFYFVTPPYLRDDVLKEIKLIKEAKENTKSPVLRYLRDYKGFLVPGEYQANARLNNFYLTSKWLNSVFPLYYQDKNCPQCLLDKDDWRLAMIAASLISTDFSDSPELKNKWARIYKVMSYFNPLREDLNYVYYRDALKSTFGENYKIEELFAESNPESRTNLEKLQKSLESLEFSLFLGAIDKKDPASRPRAGFKMLLEPYSPNDYIFSSLTYPRVDSYQGASLESSNIAACPIKEASRRCRGIALDVVNLLQPIASHSYFEENTNFLNYFQEAKKLKDKLNQDAVWTTNNYWSNLAIISSYLGADKSKLPVFARSIAWRDQMLRTSAAGWINMQLPVDKFSVNQLFGGHGFDDFSRFNDSPYIEPNLNLLNELLTRNEMAQKMFSALQINREVASVANALDVAQEQLSALKEIVIKELTGVALSAEDNETVTNFTKQLTIEPSSLANKQLTISSTQSKNGTKEDLSRLKLMVLIHQDGSDRMFSVGPVWDYRESR